jgi:hypothetical protein
VIPVLAYAVTALAVLWCGLCAWLGWRDRLINDGVLLVAAVLEIGLVVLAVLAVARFRQIDPAAEGATFLAYALSLPAVPPFATLLAIREKSRWSMIVGVVAGFTVAVMAARIAQIWSLYA